MMFSQQRTPYYDGPYIYDEQDSIQIQWVEKGFGFDTLIAKIDATIFEGDSFPRVDLTDLDYEEHDEYSFQDVSKVVAISDIHGQYDLMLELLKAHNVIDEDHNWILGDGHLVVIGDNFDRGEKVLDILWFLFNLQKEAVKEGGRLHVLLGNHEAMVLNGDLRYLNRKYIFTTAIYTTPYQDFFREGSILGDWIASHPAIIEINNDLYVHAGISPDVVRLGYSIDTINQIFKESLLRRNEQDIIQDSIHSILYTENGPLWYRGYFDSLDMAYDSINYVLNRLENNKIIVGHTSMDSIITLFNNRILDIDCSIKLGKTGQVLIIENGEYFIGEIDGSRNPIPESPQVEKKSLFETLWEMDGLPKMTIHTDVGRMIKKKYDEIYQPAKVIIENPDGKIILELPARLRARGNMRKKVCRYPPIKVDFSKSDLDSIGFHKNDKLKVVFPCKDRDSDQEMLYKEKVLYDIYTAIDSNSIRAFRIDIVLMEEGKEKNHFVGIIVEDEAEYARRKNAIIVEKGKLRAASLERVPFLKMDFFQYMIANTDWSIANKHNVEMVKLPDLQRVVSLPYDFDYSGFVGQRYAVPHESLPIESVHDRYFFSYKVSDAEFNAMVNYYASMEDEINAIIDGATYMKEKTIKQSKEYLESFFKALKNPDRMKKRMLRD
ncbi:MAG: hypothetical protein HKN68_05980 [Saprospiraceae bacterium]|nr:hypothetical protein [Saprospiraceae bacterium]